MWTCLTQEYWLFRSGWVSIIGAYLLLKLIPKFGGAGLWLLHESGSLLNGMNLNSCKKSMLRYSNADLATF